MQLKAFILLTLDSIIAVAEDVSQQIITTGRRIGPQGGKYLQKIVRR
jgi:processing peptidase subunit beta